MTDTNAPAEGAQPIADANSVDSIIDSAETNTPEPKAEPAPEPEDKPEEQFPKKAVNALSRRDKQIGKLRAQLEAERAETAKLRQAPAQTKPVNTGEPQEKDFTTYHEYIRAVNKYDAQQLLAERDTKNTESRQTEQNQAWQVKQSEELIGSAKQFIKENPEAQAIVDEYADVLDELPAQIQRIFLEAPDVAPRAIFNLAKEGKLESLGEMSFAKAAMEIGRASTQAITKPQTKAPTPLPASRGSVPSGKSLDSMSGDELLKWVNSKG